MLTEWTNKRHCGLGKEEKLTSVWDGWEGTKKNREREADSKALWLWDVQHMETGSEREAVLTGCPCGGSCLSAGLTEVRV